MKTYLVTLKNSTLVKIGKSKSIKARFNQIQVCNPFVKTRHYVDGDFERYLHFVFSDYRKVGEWFDFGELTTEQMLDTVMVAIEYRRRFENNINSCDAVNDYEASMSFLKLLNSKR